MCIRDSSVPTAFGIHEHAVGSELGIYPAVSKGGVALMSLNLLTENETDPVIWRGPVIAGTVKQFWTDVIWGDVDYMFVDMPPGTGDVPLTVFQSLPVDGVIVVTSPQDLSLIHILGGEDGVLHVLELLGDEPLAVHQGLLADIGIGHQVVIGLGDLDVIPEHLVVAHLQVLDTGLFPLRLFDLSLIHI